MSDLFWLSDRQFALMRPYFPLSHGVPRRDDREVISGILHVIINGLRWRYAPVSGHVGAKIVYPGLPNAKTLIGDKGYGSDEFRAALKAKGLFSCIPPRAKRKNPAAYRKTL